MALVPTIGHKGLAQLLTLTTSYYMVFGSGTSSEAAGNTSLVSQFTTGSFQPVLVTPIRTDNTMTWAKTITSTTNYTIGEVGIIQSTNLLIRVVGASNITVINAQQLQCTITMSI
jgi:hypothetical protein